MSMVLSLVGFVADLYGSTDHLFEAAPVVMRDRELLVAPGLEWNEASLVPYVAGTGVPIHLAKGAGFILPGDTVWVGGPSFVDGVKNCSFAEDDSYTIGGWQSSALGFRITHGHRRDFMDLVRRLRYRLEHGLHVALFDQLELFKGDAPTIYKLYAGLPVEPDMDYQLTRALYFYGTRDEYSLEFVRNETVHAFHMVKTVEDFNDAFNRKRAELKEARPGEQESILAPAAAPQPADFSFTLTQLKWLAMQPRYEHYGAWLEEASPRQRLQSLLKRSGEQVAGVNRHESELPA